jgi:protein-S-isoprenylcysteine O-methyltransferase Ste14
VAGFLVDSWENERYTMNLSSVKKAVINVLTLVLSVGPWILEAANAIHVDPTTLAGITGVLAVIGSIVHYLAPNTTTNPDVAATQSVKLVSAA